MDLGSKRVYEIELWTTSGTRLADISSLCQNRRYILTRNDAEVLTFDLDLSTFERFCASINTDAEAILTPYQMDVKLKRNGMYLFVAQIAGVEMSAQPNDTGVNPETGNYNNVTTLTETITVTCTGYLNVFLDRYIDNTTYTSEDPCQVAIDMLTATQALTNGSVGITIDPSPYMTGSQWTGTLTQQQIKQQLQTLAALPDSPFDLAIDADKMFHTYDLIGSLRKDIILTYGGPGSNVIGLYDQRTAAGTLFNQIFGLGSGNGSVSQLTSTQTNATSAIQNYLRQAYQSYSNVNTQAQLDSYVKSDLAQESKLLHIPQLIITGNELKNIPFLEVGDRIMTRFPTHSFFKSIDGVYMRIEQLDVQIDDNDFENEIAITLDDYGYTVS